MRIKFNFLFLNFLFICGFQSSSQVYNMLGSGTNNAVFELCADSVNNILYVGGRFSLAGGIQSRCIATWNGISWDSTRNQFQDPISNANAILSIVKYQNKLIVGGTLGVFDTSGNQVGYGIAFWDSLNGVWKSDSVYGSVHELAVYNGDLILGGDFMGVNNLVSYKLIRYDGTTYFDFPLLDSLGGGILTICEFNGEMYVGGNFDSQIAVNMKDIARWNGSQWLTVGGGLSGSSTFIDAMIIYQGQLIVAGWFKIATGDPGNSIAAWDGAQWSQLGSGIPTGGIRCMTVYNNDLWVGGSFSSIGGVPASNIARWDGTQWHNVGMVPDNDVFGMAVLGNDLYIGGAFITVNGDTVNRILKYNNTTGISETSIEDNNFTVSPNPANDYLQVMVLANHTGIIQKIYIYDITGRKIDNWKYIKNSNSMEIDITNVEPGTYILGVKDKERKTLTKKFIVIRP